MRAGLVVLVAVLLPLGAAAQGVPPKPAVPVAVIEQSDLQDFADLTDPETRMPNLYSRALRNWINKLVQREHGRKDVPPADQPPGQSR